MNFKKMINRIICFLIFTVFLGVSGLIIYLFYQICIDVYNNQTALQNNSYAIGTNHTPMINSIQSNEMRYITTDSTSTRYITTDPTSTRYITTDSTSTRYIKRDSTSPRYINFEALNPKTLVEEFLDFDFTKKTKGDNKIKEIFIRDRIMGFMEFYKTINLQKKLKKEELIDKIQNETYIFLYYFRDDQGRKKQLDKFWELYLKRPDFALLVIPIDIKKISDEFFSFFKNNSLTTIFKDLKCDSLKIKYLMHVTFKQIKYVVKEIVEEKRAIKTCVKIGKNLILELIKNKILRCIYDLRIELEDDGKFILNYKETSPLVRLFYPKEYYVFMFLMTTYVNIEQEAILQPFYDYCGKD